MVWYNNVVSTVKGHKPIRAVACDDATAFSFSIVMNYLKPFPFASVS